MVLKDVLGTGEPVFLRNLLYEMKFRYGQFYVPEKFVVHKIVLGTGVPVFLRNLRL